MSIDRMKHATLLVPRQRMGPVLDWLQEREVFHVEDASERHPEEDGLERPVQSSEEVQARVHELKHILHVLDNFDVKETSMADMVVQLPALVTPEQRDTIVEEFDYRPVYEECYDAAEEHHRHEAAIEEAREEIHDLEFFLNLPFTPDDLQALEKTTVWIGSMPENEFDELRASPMEAESLVLQDIRRKNDVVDMVAVALNEDAEEVDRSLRSHKFSAVPIPDVEGSISGRLTRLKADIKKHEKAADKCRERIAKMSEHQHEVEVMLGYWEAELEKVEARNNALDSERISVLSGFLPAKEQDTVDEDLKERFPQVSTVYRDPEPDDDVPVSLTHSRLVEPVTFLVDMFGMPDYFSFDPTPFLAFSFLLFFGMCFADAFYGAGLAVVGYVMARKMRPYKGMHNLCMLFSYAGIFAMVLGILSGGWASTLWKARYLGENNILLTLRSYTYIVKDPLDQAVLLLVISIGVGVVNQFYGLILRAYGLIRRGKPWDALFDAGLWFLVLPGFLIAFGSLFFDISPTTLNVGFGLMIVGGIGLILTQGRDAEGWAARFGKGLISIYGIMGSYGCVTFLSDILSYSRLVALGLTSAIVGMAFNIIAELVRSTPVVGAGLFVLILVFGHTFNFLVSMLAAFVHPARLIFLEFFNCFYEGGGIKYSPLSLTTESVVVQDHR